MLIDRANPAKQFIVLRDLQLAVFRDILSVKHILQKWHHVFHAFRTPERHENDSINTHTKEGELIKERILRRLLGNLREADVEGGDIMVLVLHRAFPFWKRTIADFEQLFFVEVK